MQMARHSPDRDVDCARIRAMFQPPIPANPFPAPVSSVSDFVLQIRETLEAHIPLCWVSGEVSGLTRATSGHLYFTLKDARAQIRCTMWRNRAQLLAFQLQDGMRVEVRGLVSIYEARGDLQLSVDTVRQAGVGNLYEAFVLLKQKLLAEGLFRADTKRPLPPLPRGIGLVCSPGAAALQDMLIALARRAPAIPLVLYPAPVQGPGACARLADAISTANARAKQDGIELLILARGGGSLEDLWAFNEEIVARAIAASAIPIVSGIGHEIDITIADLVADLRAATPTAAAELITPNHADLCETIARFADRLGREVVGRLSLGRDRLLAISRQDPLSRPLRRLREKSQLLDERQHKLRHALSHRLRLDRQRLARADVALAAFGSGVVFARRSQQLERCFTRLRSAAADSLRKRERRLTLTGRRIDQAPPLQRLAGLSERVAQEAQRVTLGLARLLERRRALLAARIETLTACAPQRVLQRGFSLTRDAKSRRILRSISEVKPGQGVITELHDGEFFSRADDPRQKQLFE